MIVRTERIGLPYFRRGKWVALHRQITRVERPIVSRDSGAVIGHQVVWDWKVKDLPVPETD